MARFTASIAVWLGCVAVAVAHPGGLDRNGGHHDRKNGGYHYHRAPATAPTPVTPPVRQDRAPRTSSRTTARKTARTEPRRLLPGPSSSRVGGESAIELEKPQPSQEPKDDSSSTAETGAVVRKAIPRRREPSARYVMHLDSGVKRKVADYKEADDVYRIQYESGAWLKYPKESVVKFEPIASDVPGAEGLPVESLVVSVVDGDTVELESGDKVRLIGVDTPETVHPAKPVEELGNEASEFTRSRLEGQRVRLEYDQSNATSAHRDKYNRLLAYLFVVDGNMDFNAEIIRHGYAHAYTTYPFNRSDEFLELQGEARTERRGLWAAPTAEASQ